MLYSVLHTPVRRTPYSCTPYSTLNTPIHALHTPYSILHTPYSILQGSILTPCAERFRIFCCTPYSSFSTLYSCTPVLRTPYSVLRLRTPYSVLQAPGRPVLRTPYSCTPEYRSVYSVLHNPCQGFSDVCLDYASSKDVRLTSASRSSRSRTPSRASSLRVAGSPHSSPACRKSSAAAASPPSPVG